MGLLVAMIIVWCGLGAIVGWLAAEIEDNWFVK